MVEWHGTVVSHTVVAWFFCNFLSDFSSHLNLCAHLACIATPMFQQLPIFIFFIWKCMPDEHRGSTGMKNVTKIYKKNHVNTAWLITVPCHSTAVHAGNILNVCSVIWIIGWSCMSKNTQIMGWSLPSHTDVSKPHIEVNDTKYILAESSLEAMVWQSQILRDFFLNVPSIKHSKAAVTELTELGIFEYSWVGDPKFGCLYLCRWDLN